MKQKKTGKAKTRGVMLPIALLLMTTLVACGKKEESALSLNNGENDSTSDIRTMSDEDIKKLYYFTEAPQIELQENGNYVIDSVELCEPIIDEEDIDSKWMGYSEIELGLLTPEEMPNCFDYGKEVGKYMPGVEYEGKLYWYVNDYIESFVGIARTEEDYEKLEKLKEYANVWCTFPNPEIIVLGGLYEYGKECAKQGGNAE